MDHIDDEEEEEEFCEYCGEPLEYGLCTGNCEQSLIENGLDDDEGIIFLLYASSANREDMCKAMQEFIDKYGTKKQVN